MASHLKENCVHVHDLSHCINKYSSVNPTLEFPVVSNSAVRVIHNLLTPDECSSLIRHVEECGLSPPIKFDKSVRDCDRRHTLDVNMSHAIMPRVYPFLPEIQTVDGVRWKLNRFTHHWRYVRYQVGGQFVPHWDGAKLMPHLKMTMLTVQIYLNADFEGGCTRFYMDHCAEQTASHDIPYGSGQISITSQPTHCVTPRTGSVLVFDHAGRSVLHDGQPVAAGVKYIMRCDLLYEVIPDDIPLMLSKIQHKQCKMYCPQTAARNGTRNFIGQVWLCWCGVDQLGSCSHITATNSVEERNVIATRVTSANACHQHHQCTSIELGAGDTCAEDRPSNHEFPTFAMTSVIRGNCACKPSGAYVTTASSATVQSSSLLTDATIVLISGKRASGKDHLARLLETMLISNGHGVQIIALGSINKRLFAAEHGLDFQRLLVDRVYKEQFRVAMVAAHAQRDLGDPEWCVREVMTSFAASFSDINSGRHNVLIVPDLRMKNDVDAFRQVANEHGMKCIVLRVNASDSCRAARGWSFDDVKDTLPTETDMDDAWEQWTACVDNSSNSTFSCQDILAEWIESTVFPRMF